MISKLVSRQLLNKQRLIRFKQVEQYLQPKRNHWIDNPPQRLLYRDLGHKQDTADWYGSVGLMGMLVATTLVNAYMYWDEIKLEDPPGVYSDLSVHANNDLGIPPDDQFGYAPIKQELLDSNNVVDLGNTLRSENRLVYHVYMIRKNLPNPYDV